MNRPWEIKQEDARTEDSLLNFIIFCEDKVSEPTYLRYFHTPKIKVNYILNQKSMMTNVLQAINHCQESGLIHFKDGEYCLLDGTQVWCVFDRDKEDTEEKINLGNVSFNESIETAQRRGIKLAWSNDSFELWILLHFEDVNLEDKEREKYYSRLSEIFRNLENPNSDLEKVLKHGTYSYKKDLKSENNFRSIVRDTIVGNTKKAIERAKNLESKFKSNELQSHEKAPCTLVHHLVEELIKCGGKEI